MIDITEMRKAQLKITRDNLANLDKTADTLHDEGYVDRSSFSREDLKKELLKREAMLVDLIENADNNVITFEEARMLRELRDFSESV